ncbi:MAG: transcriptional repressor LexA [Deltaproteobacteria bacterium]|nr:transcriptional repressor LexA [Deltaproteobacteria bacterium]
MTGLTKRQQMVLDYIRKSIDDRGFPPTLREIGVFMGIRSTNGVNDHLRALERKGYLKREDMKSRALRPTTGVRTTSYSEIEIPILGRVAAGAPLLATENLEGSVTVDRYFIGNNREVFGLRVRGDSMIEAGILDGDYVFVRKQLTAERGDVVVAMIGEDATVKYWFPERDYIRLQPANSQLAPILVRRDDFRTTQLLGIVIGVYRRLH